MIVRKGVLTIAVGLGLASCGLAQDVTQWRGANRDAKLTGFVAPAVWPKALTQVWKVKVGIGHASPLVVGKSVFVFARDGEEEVARCLDIASGKTLWQTRYAAPYTMNPAAQGHGKGPKSTPVYASGRLYTLGISGILSCFDAKSGKLVWRKDFSPEYSQTSPEFGTAMSPLVDNGLLIAHIGGSGKGALTAFDAKTGAVKWQWKGDGPAYASPIVVTMGGVRQVVTQTQKLCVGVDAATGKLLWSLPFTTPYEQNSVTPTLVGDQVVFAGLQQPTFAVRLQKSGAGWSAARVWETRDAMFYMSSPVVSGNRVYGLSSKRGGQMFSLDPTTGKVLWTGEGRTGENASVWDGNSVVLALTTGADLLVFKKSGDSLTEAARYHVADSATWASPAVSGNRILVKDDDSLTLWTIPTAQKLTQKAMR